MKARSPESLSLRAFSLATAMALLCAGAARAEEVKIQSDVTQTTILKNSMTAGEGAVSRFSSVGGGADIRGDLDLTSIVEQHATISTSAGGKAQTSVATVHGKQKIRGKTKRTVVVKTIINVGGCVAVGSINAPCL